MRNQHTNFYDKNTNHKKLTVKMDEEDRLGNGIKVTKRNAKRW
jgi:hypothetical protein